MSFHCLRSRARVKAVWLLCGARRFRRPDDCIAPKVRKVEMKTLRPKTETSVRRVSIPQEAVDLLIQGHEKHTDNPYMFPSPATGEMYYPDPVVKLHEKIPKDAGLEHIRFHGLRHTYVKPKTQILSRKLMGLRAKSWT